MEAATLPLGDEAGVEWATKPILPQPETQCQDLNQDMSAKPLMGFWNWGSI